MSAVLAQAPEDGRKPLWVSERPSPEGYFVGIGVARRGGDLSRSRDMALDNALNHIGAQIETSVFSDVRITEMENAQALQQEYRAEIKTMVSATLEGVEIVDTWDDEQECWAYTRLSIVEFHRRRQEKTDRARRLAAELVAGAETEMISGSPVQALCRYVQALEPIGTYLADPLATQHGESLALEADVSRRIQEILSAVQLTASPVGGGPLGQGREMAIPLMVTARLRDSGGETRPAARLPISYRFTVGSGQVSDWAWTDEEGTATGTLSRVHAKAPVQIVRAEIDLGTWAADQTRDPRAGDKLRQLAVPFVVFRLDVLTRTAALVCREANLGQDLEVAQIAPVVKAGLGDRGLVFIDDRHKADLLIEVEAVTRQGQALHGICFAFLDLTLSVSDRASGDRLYSTSLANVKGAGATYEQAGMKAFEAAGRQLTSSVLQSLFSQIGK